MALPGTPGRVAAAAKSMNVVALGTTGTSSGLTPPSSLTTAERALFTEIVSSCDPRHFVRSDLPLLTSFVQATLLVRNAAPKAAKGDLNAIAAWEKAVKIQALLCTRLRLAPQSRVGLHKTLGRSAAKVSETYYDVED
jgi:hypothetical protein